MNAYEWTKKTYNNAVSVVRRAFDYGYKDHPEKHNPAVGLKCLRITKKDRPVVDPFTIDEAESLIVQLRADWGDAIGNYDELRFFTGLRPSEQIALLVTDFDERKGVLRVTKARVLRRDKDRTKTQEDRNVDLTPRAIQVLKAHLELRAAYVAAGKISHDRLFFLEDGSAISDPEVTRWRSNESLQKLAIRQRGPYHARHSSVTWALVLGKNPLWVAKQHGHSVEVMLRMYAAWIEGATEVDIQAIRNAMDGRPKGRDVQKSLRDFVEPGGFVHTPCSVKTKSPMTGLFVFTDGGEGGITRRFAPRPSGAALAGVIPASLLPRSATPCRK